MYFILKCSCWHKKGMYLMLHNYNFAFLQFSITIHYKSTLSTIIYILHLVTKIIDRLFKLLR